MIRVLNVPDAEKKYFGWDRWRELPLFLEAEIPQKFLFILSP